MKLSFPRLFPRFGRIDRITDEHLRDTANSAVLFGVVLSVALLCAVFLFGQTFGQRCEDQGIKSGSPEHGACVQRLSSGG